MHTYIQKKEKHKVLNNFIYTQEKKKKFLIIHTKKKKKKKHKVLNDFIYT